MINELLKKINSSDHTTLKTDSLEITGNALIMEDTSIQINNVSMISRNEFKSPITIIETLIAVGLLLISFAFPPLFIVSGLFVAYLYLKYQQHKQTKYFMTFNLGSSTNYNLYFENSDFRDQVYKTVEAAFTHHKQNIFIDLKNENIENQTVQQTIFENGSTQNNIKGDKNIVDSNINNSQISSGDNNQQISKELNKKTLPWTTISVDIDNLLKQEIPSEEINHLLQELKTISDKQDEQAFKDTISSNKELLSKNFMKDLLSGTLANVISSIITSSFN